MASLSVTVATLRSLVLSGVAKWQQGCTLAEPCDPQRPAFALKQLEFLSFIQIIMIVMMDTLDFTVSAHWVPFSFPWSMALDKAIVRASFTFLWIYHLVMCRLLMIKKP